MFIYTPLHSSVLSTAMHSLHSNKYENLDRINLKFIFTTTKRWRCSGMCLCVCLWRISMILALLRATKPSMLFVGSFQSIYQSTSINIFITTTNNNRSIHEIAYTCAWCSLVLIGQVMEERYMLSVQFQSGQLKIKNIYNILKRT